jgi:hypothetical protein
MDIKRNRKIDRSYAEKLLTGDATVDGALADVLAAASAPADPRELQGEDTAVAMFHAARTGLTSPADARAHSATVVSRLLTARFAALLLLFVGLGIGGVAVAASTGVIPALPHHRGTPGGPVSPHLPRPPSGSTSAPTPHADPSAPNVSSSGSLSTSLPGQCHAYMAQVSAGHTSVVNDHRFARLIAAAGGASNVVSYCQVLLARPSSGAGAGGTPAPHPTGNPNAHSTGKPTAHPGGTPNSHAAH